MVGGSADRSFLRRCVRRCSRLTARISTKPSPTRPRGRSIVTTCSGASSSITWRNDTVRGRCPTGWLVAQEAFDRLCLVERARRSIRWQQPVGGMEGLDRHRTADALRLGTSFERARRVSRRRRVCATARISPRFHARRPTDRGSRFLATDEGRQPLGLYVADLQTCHARRITRVNSPHAFSWTGDGRSIVFSQLELVDTARAFGDLLSNRRRLRRCDPPHAIRAARFTRRTPKRPDGRGRAVRARAEPAGDGRSGVGHGDGTDGVRRAYSMGARSLVA